LPLWGSLPDLFEIYVLAHSELNLAVHVDRAYKVFRVDRVSVATKGADRSLLDLHHVHSFVNQVFVNN
jgi:hypothetical protein